MHELFLKKILKTLQMNSARAGKKEGGWGEGIFARPRFPPLLFSPPQFFVPAKLARRQNIFLITILADIIVFVNFLLDRYLSTLIYLICLPIGK